MKTKYGVDKSCNLKHILKECGSWAEMLGEFQFSFITFLYGQNYVSFEQWKKFVEVICRSDECMENNEYDDLYCNFLTSFYHQLNEFDEGIFNDLIEDSGSNFITLSLKELFSHDILKRENRKSKSIYEKFRELVQKKFKINFDDEIDDEDEPTIVALEDVTKHWTEEERLQFYNSI